MAFRSIDIFGQTFDIDIPESRERDIYIAASNAPNWQKAKADIVCDGVNDELDIQQAVNTIYNQGGGGIIQLSRGTFYIDSFPNEQTEENSTTTYTAILLPSSSSGYEIRILGDLLAIGAGGTRFTLKNEVYESLDASKQYKIFSARYSAGGLKNDAMISLIMRDVHIRLPYNQRKIMCIDLLNVNRVLLERIYCSGYTSSYTGDTWTTNSPKVPKAAVQGCVGIRMTGGSNFGVCCDYRNIICQGFYEGFQVGGEHVVGINLSGIHNVYSYTFGNYKWLDMLSHPITLINCCDERSVNLPLFVKCGNQPTLQAGGQEVVMLNFNVERVASETPGGAVGDYAKEITPGQFNGFIDYTMVAPSWAQGNGVTEPFWDTGKINGVCHGANFKSRNTTQSLSATKSTLATYAPNFLQQVWLTDENKMVYCIDTANKTWVDAQGNIVSLT